YTISLHEALQILKKDELSVFKGIQFYPYKDEFVIETKVEYLENQLPFEMATTGDKIQKYIRVAFLHFEIASNKYQLELYQNVQLRENRSEEHTSELQSRENLVCRLLLEKK